jgi:hypothetical protein
VWSKLKQEMKRRFRGHIREEMARASSDIFLARRHKAAVEAAAFVDQFMPQTKCYTDRFQLLSAALAQVEIPGLYCEFGVFRAETLNFIASLLPEEIHGFDSFQGLPEDWWNGHNKGTFAVDGLPQVRANVRLHPGWFESSIPLFMKENAGPIAFLHIDADLYSSTHTIFELLGERIVAGTVLQFDEFFNYPGWQAGEYKAFTEFCLAGRVEVRYLGYVRCDQQVAMKVVNIQGQTSLQAESGAA